MRHRNLMKNQALYEAKALFDSERREWLMGKAPDCYADPVYETEIYVLQGSPAKGYILVLGWRGSGAVIALDLSGYLMRRFEYTTRPQCKSVFDGNHCDQEPEHSGKHRSHYSATGNIQSISWTDAGLTRVLEGQTVKF